MEGVAELLPHLVQDQEGLLHHVGADAVPGDHSEFVFHGIYASCLFLMSAMRPPAWMISLMNSGKGLAW